MSVTITMTKAKEQLNCKQFSLSLSVALFFTWFSSRASEMMMVDCITFFFRIHFNTPNICILTIWLFVIRISILFVCCCCFYISLLVVSESEKQHDNRHGVLTKEFDQFTFCNQHKWKSVRYSIVVLIRLSKWKCVWFLLLVTTLIHWKCIFFSFSLVYHLREFNFGMHSFSPQTRMKIKYETRDTTTAKWFDCIVARTISQTKFTKL